MSTPIAASCLAAVAAAALSGCTSSPRTLQAQGVTAPLDVQFKLTDLNYAPVPSVEVRVAFGPADAWQNPDSGTRFVTDAAGEFRFSTSVVLEPQLKTMPTNFADSMRAKPQPTDHLLVAAELPYISFRWVYVVDLWRFRDGGDVLTEGLTAVYTPDDRGRFTRQARRVEGGGWLMADLKGLALTTPGFEPWECRLEPGAGDSNSARWALKLAFKRWPPPVKR